MGRASVGLNSSDRAALQLLQLEVERLQEQLEQVPPAPRPFDSDQSAA